MTNLNRMKKLLQQIDKNKTYFNVHAGDVLGSVFLIIITILSFTYLAVKKNNIKIRKEWAIHKCKPNISPLAGFINARPGATFNEKLEYTKNNYISCNENILKTNIVSFITPLENMQHIIRVLYDLAKSAIDRVALLYEILKARLIDVMRVIFAKINVIIIELQVLLFRVKDTIMKSAGILQVMFMWVVSVAYFLMTLINSFFEIVKIILIIYTAVIFTLAVIAALLFFWFPPGGLAIASTAGALLSAYLALAIPTIIALVLIARIMDEVEKRENLICFHPETKIKLANGKYKAMKDLNLGEILTKNIEVIAVLRIKGESKDKYYKIYSEELNDYIYVTGTHLIMHPKTKKFIPVEKYEGASITNSWTNEMSCLVTSNNKIPIGEYTFWDWED